MDDGARDELLARSDDASTLFELEGLKTSSLPALPYRDSSSARLATRARFLGALWVVLGATAMLYSGYTLGAHSVSSMPHDPFAWLAQYLSRGELGSVSDANDEGPAWRPVRFPEPQAHWQDNVLPGRNYRGNQVFETIHTIYLSLLTDFSPVLPGIIATGHVANGGMVRASDHFDLDLLSRYLDLPLAEWHDFKPAGYGGQDTSLGTPQISEPFPCFMNLGTGTVSLDAYGLSAVFWPMVTNARAGAGDDISNTFNYERLAAWLLNPDTRRSAVAERRDELRANQADVPMEPRDNFVCLSNTFYLNPRSHVRGSEVDVSTGRDSFPSGSELLWNEDQAWLHVGRYMWYRHDIELAASDALHQLLDVPVSRTLPPLITVHLRRTDFGHNGRTLAAIESYANAVASVRARLGAGYQAVLAEHLGPLGNHRNDFTVDMVDDIRVVCTTDEPDHDFIRNEIVPVVPCVYANHTLLDTVGRYGAWFPTVIDAVILSRGIGFVGTSESTVSSLASLRVKHWQRGPTAWSTNF